MNYVKRLLVVDEKTQKKQYIYPEKVIYDSLIETLKSHLKEGPAVMVAEELIIQCVFPDLTKTIIIIDKDGTIKKTNLKNHKVTEISIDDLVPVFPYREKNIVFDTAINELKSKIIDFSSAKFINPVGLIQNLKVS